MGLMDKITGRTKKAVGDVTGDSATRRQGAREERKGEAEEELEHQRDKLTDKAQEVSDLDNKT